MAGPATTLPPSDPVALAKRHATLRFAVAVSGLLVLCEAMNWRPTYLPALLAGLLLANLPMRPPLKLGGVLVAAMAFSALFAWMLSILLQHAPTVLFGAIALTMFVTFLAMLRGAPALPAILLLVCLSTVPIIAMAYPAQAIVMPKALMRSIVMALLTIWLVHAIWPATLPPAPKPPPPTPASAAAPSPMATALTATAIVVPMMLGYLMFAPTQALPVLLGTVLLVANFDPERSRQDAIDRVLANAGGGVTGQLAYWVLLMGPSLLTLWLIVFVLAWLLGARIAEGGPRVPSLVYASNAMLIILSSSIAAGPGEPGMWITRVVQFSLAGLFAVGAMYLVWHWTTPATRAPA